MAKNDALTPHDGTTSNRVRSVFPLIVRIANIGWFTAGFVSFAGRAPTHARNLTRQDPGSQAASVATGLLRFLGGLNLGFAILSAMTPMKGDHRSGRAINAAITTAHASQAAVNIPVAVSELRGQRTVWSVRRFPMSLIFVGDLILAAGNAVVLTLR